VGWIAWIVVGAIAGFIASRLVGSREGLVMMIVLGIVGGLLGGFVAANVLHVGSVNGFNVESILIATLGAVAVLLVMHMATGSRGGLRRGWR
jgi:uncharacterized membrane protein YeaQ/YmgE (transglycosylase-associated protein family)